MNNNDFLKEIEILFNMDDNPLKRHRLKKIIEKIQKDAVEKSKEEENKYAINRETRENI
jgi:hypothetical protein